MSLKVAVQMDPIEGINIEGDTTFLMMEAAQARGHSLFDCWWRCCSSPHPGPHRHQLLSCRFCDPRGDHARSYCFSPDGCPFLPASGEERDS